MGTKDVNCGPRAYPTSPHMLWAISAGPGSFFWASLSPLCSVPNSYCHECWLLFCGSWQIILLYNASAESIYLVHMSAGIYSFLSLSLLSSSVSTIYLYGTNLYAFRACVSIISTFICYPNDHLFMIHHECLYWLPSKHHWEKACASVYAIHDFVFEGVTRPW